MAKSRKKKKKKKQKQSKKQSQTVAKAPVAEDAAQETSETAAEPAPEKAEESTPEQAEERAAEQAEERAAEQAEEPAAEQAEEPAAEQAEESAAEQAEEPATEQAEETATEQDEEAAEQAEESATDQAEEVDPEQTVEMTPEQRAKAEERAKDVELTEAGDERRRRYRLNKVLGATLTSSTGDINKSRLFVIDISATGFRATDHTPHTESEYQIEIILTKGEEPFKSKMRVVWSKELTVSGMFQMGCEFLDISPEEKERLETFIEGERYKLENAPKKPIDLGRPWTMIK